MLLGYSALTQSLTINSTQTLSISNITYKLEHEKYPKTTLQQSYVQNTPQNGKFSEGQKRRKLRLNFFLLFLEKPKKSLVGLLASTRCKFHLKKCRFCIGAKKSKV